MDLPGVKSRAHFKSVCLKKKNNEVAKLENEFLAPGESKGYLCLLEFFHGSSSC